MIKICHVTSAHNSDDARIFQKECVSMARNGYDTYLVARGDSREEKSVHVIGMGDQKGGRLSRITTFARTVYKKALSLDCDIYHLHDPELLPYAVRLHNNGKKVIFDSHECYPIQIAEKDYIPRCLRWLLSSLYKMYETYVFKKINAVIIPCTINGVNVLEGRSRSNALISNEVNLYDFRIEPRSANSNRIVCYTGALSENRGITNLIKATYQANAVLYLAGKFSSPEYQHTLEGMKEYSCVKYFGIVDHEEVKKIYRASSAGAQVILPVGQYYAGDVLGVKVAEYMAMELPVILSDSPYMKKTMETYRYGICVNPCSIDEIASAIDKITGNTKLAEELGKNGRRAVELHFNWQVQERKLIALYEKLIEDA